MYALLLTLLSAVSVDCPTVIQLALDMDIKYTNTDYFIQYEQDCCLGVGVVCQNETVTEIHWGFTSDYKQATHPNIILPPSLRVLDLAYSTKSMMITKLPDSLKVMDLTEANYIRFNLNAFPNLTYFILGDYDETNPPNLPILPDSLEYIDLYGHIYDIYPKNAMNLKTLYNNGLYSYVNYVPRRFPNLPDTIEFLDLQFSHLYGPISFDFKHIKELQLRGNQITGNLTIASPNITSLNIAFNKIDNLFVLNPQKLKTCNIGYIQFDTSNNNDLLALQPYGCSYSLKTTPSPDCPNFIQFLKQLNMHLTSPDYFNKIENSQNCCDGFYGCSSNRISSIQFYEQNLNGTINGTLLPNTLNILELRMNQITGPFPDLSHLVNLNSLELYDNQLTGPISGKLPPNLKVVQLDRNRLNGTIPNILSIKTLRVSQNQFTAVENELQGSQIEFIDLSYNQIKGVIDMTGFYSSRPIYFRFRSNFIDKIWAKPGTTALFCDVSYNMIPQNQMGNFTNCKTQYQWYTEPSYLDSCKYVLRMFHKMNLSPPFLVEENCCDDPYGTVTCVNQNVTALNINQIDQLILNTVNGYVFDVEDIPPSLQTLKISFKFNQTAKLPPTLPGHIKYFEVGNINIGGALPKFEEGLETLKMTNLDLKGDVSSLPSTLTSVELMYCGLKGVLPPLPPNLTELQIQGNYFIGPLPTFPDSLQTIVLGDNAREGNTFNDKLFVNHPKTLILGNTNISSIEIKNTTLLTNCDVSYNPLLNSTFIGNYTMCKKYYLTPKPLQLQIVLSSSLISTTISSSFTRETSGDSTEIVVTSSKSAEFTVSVPANTAEWSAFSSELQNDAPSSNLHLFSHNTYSIQKNHIAFIQ
eukprot:NODE_715_length_4508_cov_0.874121.p1 type:complete len:864 gc:universal NODE_715_length_4508_cov_0.874121:3026-435(-)